MKNVVIVIGINLAALVGVFFFFKNRIDRALRSNEIVTVIKEEIEQLLIELNQTTNRNVEIVEERISRLKDIIAKADKSIVLLHKEVDLQQKKADVYTNIRPKPAAAAAAKSREQSAAGKKENSTVREERSTREQVLEMVQRGTASDTIAQRLGITLAEVELIISLDERKG